jgi:hypothetical protein
MVRFDLYEAGERQMEDRSVSNTLMVVLIAVLAVGGALYFYNNYVEPQNDGPMEKAGEKLDDAMSRK